MARLIPAFTDDRTPSGEKDVFRMLAGGPDDWIAIHSLDLAPWNRGLRTEIDFVIIVPDTGVVCVEVKSHSSILFEDDRWKPPEIRRSPFKQAADGRYNFHRRLCMLAPELRHLPVVHCCIFPNAPFTLAPNITAQPWELIDGLQFRSFRSSADFCIHLRNCMLRSIETDESLHRLQSPLAPTEAGRIAQFCTPVHKRRAGAREEILQREQEAERMLREQQRPVLRLAEVNSRIVVDGAAGTGKTLIALELAIRAARLGKRVALVCFNQLIGEWIARNAVHMSAGLPNLVAGRAIRLMADMAGIQIPEHPSREFWDDELPSRLEERLTDPDFSANAVFDYLIIDEAQDLLARPRLWSCLTQFLDGNVHNGSYALFGDFTHQVLAEKDAMNTTLRELIWSSRPARWNLSENCRNYEVVGNTAVRLSGFGPQVYSGYMRTGGSHANYDIAFYRTPEDQTAQIRRWLAEFRAAGYKPSEIAILSFCAEQSSAAAQLVREGFSIQPARRGGDGMTYATVHAFKGLEKKVILLTDLVFGHSDFHRHLFYTGMTRATEIVRILCHENSKAVLRQWISQQEEA